MNKKINLRRIFRLLVGFLIGLQVALVIILLAGGKNSEASEAFTLGIWMTFTLIFESKAHRLQTEKENLESFLNNPSTTEQVESEGGEA